MKSMRLLLLYASFGLPIALFAQGGQGCYEDLFPKRNEKGMVGYANLYGQWKVEPVFSEVRPFSGDKAIVKKGKKIGVVNCDGYLVLPCEYDEVAPFSVGRFWAKKAGKWYFFETNGKVLREGEFSEIKEISLNSNSTWVKKGDSYGLFSKKENKFLIEPQFSLFQPMSDSASLVKKGNLLGVVSNTTGEYLIDPAFEKVKKQTSRLIAFKENGQWGVMTPGGKVIKPAEYDSLEKIHPMMVLVKKEGKFGILNLNAQPVLPIAYDGIGAFSEGLAPVYQNGKAGYFTILQTLLPLAYDSCFAFKNSCAIIKKNNAYGLVSNQGKELLPATYPWMKRDINQKYLVTKTKETVQLYQLGNGWVQKDFEAVDWADTSIAIRVKESGKWGYFSLLSKGYLITPTYDSLGKWSPGLVIAKKNGKVGVIDAKENSVVPFEYESIQKEMIGVTLKFRVSKQGKVGILDVSGKTVIPVAYDYLVLADPSVYKFKKENTYGLLKTMGQPLTKEEFTFMSIGSKDLPEWPALIQFKGKWGWILATGEMTLEPAYTQIDYLGEGMYAIRKGKKVGIQHASGKLPTETKWDDVQSFKDGQALFQSKGRWGVVNTQGQVLVEPEYQSVGVNATGQRTLTKDGKTFILGRNGALK